MLFSFLYHLTVNLLKMNLLKIHYRLKCGSRVPTVLYLHFFYHFLLEGTRAWPPMGPPVPPASGNPTDVRPTRGAGPN